MAAPMTDEQKKKNQFGLPTDIYAEGSPTVAAQNKMPGNAFAQGVGAVTAGTMENGGAILADGTQKLVNAAVTGTGGKILGNFTNNAVDKVSSDLQNQQENASELSATGKTVDSRVNAISKGMSTAPAGQMVGVTPNTDVSKPSTLNVFGKGVSDTTPDQPVIPLSPSAPAVSLQKDNTVTPENTSPVQNTAPQDRSFGYIKNLNTGRQASMSGPVSTESSQVNAFSPNINNAVQAVSRIQQPTQQAEVTNSFSKIPAPKYITPEQAKEMGLGWKSRNAMNKTISDDYHAKLSASGQGDAGANQVSMANSRNSFDASAAGSKIAADADIHSQNRFSAEKIASDRNATELKRANMFRGLNPQEEIAALDTEAQDPQTSPGRREEIAKQKQLIQVGGRGTSQPQPKVVEIDSGRIDQFKNPIMVPAVLNPDGKTATRITEAGVKHTPESVINSNPQYKAAYESANAEGKKKMLASVSKTLGM